MNVLYIALAILSYLLTGCFTAGFMGLSVDDLLDIIVFWAVALLWPCILLGWTTVVIFALPIRLGKKLGKRYLHIVDGFFDKIVYGEKEAE